MSAEPLGGEDVAYSRFGPLSDWYIFWNAQDQPVGKHQEILSLWKSHQDCSSAASNPKYESVERMLSSGDLAEIPGYESRDRELLLAAMREFIADVDKYYREEVDVD